MLKLNQNLLNTFRKGMKEGVSGNSNQHPFQLRSASSQITSMSGKVWTFRHGYSVSLGGTPKLMKKRKLSIS